MNRGMMALILVLIIGAAALAMAVSANLLSVGNLELGQVDQGGAAALAAAEGCLAEALIYQKRDPSYSGGNWTGCEASVTTISGTERELAVRGSVGDYTREMVVRVDLAGGRPELLSWSEQ